MYEARIIKYVHNRKQPLEKESKQTFNQCLDSVLDRCRATGRVEIKKKMI
jgi:hypothetical protein